MEPLVTKEQVIEILRDHGHQVVMGSYFVVGSPISEIEAIVNVCDVVSQQAYQNGRQDAIAEYGKEWYGNEMSKLSNELAPKPDKNKAEELEKAIQTIQVALSGSFRDNLKIEITEQHAWLHYGDLKFLVEPMESWQAVQSCVYLSGLEVE